VFDAKVKVLSGNRHYAESVAEGVLGYMLFELRKMGHFSFGLKNGVWPEGGDAYTEGLLGQTVGIISLGQVSRILMKLLKPFRVKIKVYSTRRDMAFAEEAGFSYADLDEIFSTCKIISVHTARTPKTIKMLGKKHFQLIKEGGIFINTARGEVIDEDALIEELKKKRFRALLDVYNEEPLPPDSPLPGLDNLTLFPHQAGPTVDRRAAITGYLIDDIEAFFGGGEMYNEITRETAERMTK
jgi:phosphoglycerate dehydrogenase-like enzyme